MIAGDSAHSGEFSPMARAGKFIMDGNRAQMSDPMVADSMGVDLTEQGYGAGQPSASNAMRPSPAMASGSMYDYGASSAMSSAMAPTSMTSPSMVPPGMVSGGMVSGGMVSGGMVPGSMVRHSSMMSMGMGMGGMMP